MPGSGSEAGVSASATKPATSASTVTAHRRAQVRQAQRAYRSRKEQLLHTLEDQVGELSQSAATTQDAVLAVLEQCIAAGLDETHPGIVRGLKGVVGGTNSKEKSKGAVFKYKSKMKSGQATRSARAAANSEDLANSVHVGLGYSVVTGSKQEQQILNPFAAPEWIGGDAQKSHWRTDTIFDDWLGAVSVPRELKPQDSVAYHESSFARYFHRHCLELSIKLILTNDDVEIRRKLWYPLQFLSRNELIRRCKERLDRGQHESLDSWYYYPNVTQQNPWLRPEDIERYLAACGIVIDPAVPYALIQPTEPNAFAQEAAERESGTELAGFVMPEDITLTLDASLPTLYDQEMGESPASFPFTQQSTPGSSQQQSIVPSPMNTKPSLLDVQRFVDELMLSTTCYGKTPATLRVDVDRAISVASF